MTDTRLTVNPSTGLGVPQRGDAERACPHCGGKMRKMRFTRWIGDCYVGQYWECADPHCQHRILLNPRWRSG